MSAGTGIAHSEYNHSEQEQVNFLQIWIQPNPMGLTPSYQQKEFDHISEQWQTLVSPDRRDGSLKIHQDAWISLIDSQPKNVSYTLVDPNHGIYMFVLEGQAQLGEHHLKKRDAVMLSDFDAVEFEIKNPSKIHLYTSC